MVICVSGVSCDIYLSLSLPTVSSFSYSSLLMEEKRWTLRQNIFLYSCLFGNLFYFFLSVSVFLSFPAKFRLIDFPFFEEKINFRFRTFPPKISDFENGLTAPISWETSSWI